MAKERIMYKSSFIKALTKAFETNPTLTIGEMIYSIVKSDRLGGEHFFKATDAAIYSSLERLNEADENVKDDEILTEQEFIFWVDRVTKQL